MILNKVIRKIIYLAILIIAVVLWKYGSFDLNKIIFNFKKEIGFNSTDCAKTIPLENNRQYELIRINDFTENGTISSIIYFNGNIYLGFTNNNVNKKLRIKVPDIEPDKAAQQIVESGKIKRIGGIFYNQNNRWTPLNKGLPNQVIKVHEENQGITVNEGYFVYPEVTRVGSFYNINSNLFADTFNGLFELSNEGWKKVNRYDERADNITLQTILPTKEEIITISGNTTFIIDNDFMNSKNFYFPYSTNPMLLEENGRIFGLFSVNSKENQAVFLTELQDLSEWNVLRMIEGDWLYSAVTDNDKIIATTFDHGLMSFAVEPNNAPVTFDNRKEFLEHGILAKFEDDIYFWQSKCVYVKRNKSFDWQTLNVRGKKELLGNISSFNMHNGKIYLGTSEGQFYLLANKEGNYQ